MFKFKTAESRKRWDRLFNKAMSLDTIHYSEFRDIHSLYYDNSSEADDNLIMGKLGFSRQTFRGIMYHYPASSKQMKRIISLMNDLLK